MGVRFSLFFAFKFANTRQGSCCRLLLKKVYGLSNRLNVPVSSFRLEEQGRKRLSYWSLLSEKINFETSVLLPSGVLDCLAMLILTN